MVPLEFFQHFSEHPATVIDAPVGGQMFDLLGKFTHRQGVAHKAGPDLFRDFAELPFVGRPVGFGRLVLGLDFWNEIGQ